MAYNGSRAAVLQQNYYLKSHFCCVLLLLNTAALLLQYGICCCYYFNLESAHSHNTHRFSSSPIFASTFIVFIFWIFCDGISRSLSTPESNRELLSCSRSLVRTASESSFASSSTNDFKLYQLQIAFDSIHKFKWMNHCYSRRKIEFCFQ